MNITALASGSSGNAYLVTDGESSILIECGLPFKKLREALDFKLTSVAGCLISHHHLDHSKAAKELTKAGVNCYGSWETLEIISARGANTHRLFQVKPNEELGFNKTPWVFLPFETAHDTQGSLGFLIGHKETGEKLLFATDSMYLKHRFIGLTHIMIECNYAADILAKNVAAGRVAPELKNRIIKSHMSLSTVKACLRANDLSKVSEIWLIHLSDQNSDEERFKREIQEVSGKVVRVA